MGSSRARGVLGKDGRRSQVRALLLPLRSPMSENVCRAAGSADHRRARPVSPPDVPEAGRQPTPVERPRRQGDCTFRRGEV
ncbi:hypothetical protein AAFF_G00095520 [Aldrovandia affinis]|uniref:Uncharacterized protein n=1 Tax=Aldrovandia affinis TaxID=143900 RepID=A0AAD7WC05_9TELE|nr:hypothetical protein AAFF_G00095520 [Aldrovandia affinis]